MRTLPTPMDRTDWERFAPTPIESIQPGTRIVADSPFYDYMTVTDVTRHPGQYRTTYRVLWADGSQSEYYDGTRLYVA